MTETINLRRDHGNNCPNGCGCYLYTNTTKQEKVDYCILCGYKKVEKLQ